MEENEEILDELIEQENSDYDATSELDEGYALKRITFKGLLGFVLSVLNFEKGILFTIRELIIRPKQVIEEYLKRDRKKLVNPVRFLVFSTALATFLTFSVLPNNEMNNFGVAFSDGFNQGMGEKVEGIENKAPLPDSIHTIKEINHLATKKLRKKQSQKAAQDFGIMMKQSTDKISFALVFFFAFGCLLFFKNIGYNYTENLVINSFMVSMNNVITIILVIPALAFGGSFWIVLGSLIGLAYFFYFWMVVYNRKSIGGFFRCLINYFVSYLAFSIVFGGLIILYFIVRLG